MKNPQEQIETLRKQVHEHNYTYYVLSRPVISDFEFDRMMKELMELEAAHPEYHDPNSPSVRVGSDISNRFTQVAHRFPMLSLQNTYSEGEVAEFFNRVQRALNEEFAIVGELKYDGTSISLVYENGRLTRAVTRGDGSKGDDVTANVRTIRNVPLILKGDDMPAYLEARGEIVMPWSSFEALNAERAEQGEQLFANPRNATSGTMKLLDSRVVASRGLESYIFNVTADPMPTRSHFENMTRAKQWGLNVSDAMRKCSSLEEVVDFLRWCNKERENLLIRLLLSKTITSHLKIIRLSVSYLDAME